MGGRCVQAERIIESLYQSVVWGSCQCTQSHWECGALAAACPTSTSGASVGRNRHFRALVRSFQSVTSKWSSCRWRKWIAAVGLELSPRHRRVEVSWGESRYMANVSLRVESSAAFFPLSKAKKKKNSYAVSWSEVLPRHYAVFSSFLGHFFRPHERVSVSNPDGFPSSCRPEHVWPNN